ncbi:MAG: hypothetical protein QNJ54_32515 [Prochloraceae cyanobacterium]|nr:hypothetical protein [Prochloraceae cyanobacterium]
MRGSETTPRKNRINFLELLRGETTQYVLSNEALTYMSTHRLPQQQLQNLSLWCNRVFKDKQEWLTTLKVLGIEKDSERENCHRRSFAGGCLS